ncbi:cysteine/glutathione ABC transporter permease/ATP-binding protein CydD, partial [Shewanella sp. A25]|nr:cysteine/glutathione ABC transporter permease/ATP-binding protein CydD [Shewanella shenzhenensis]
AKAQAIGAAEALMELLNAPEPLANGAQPLPVGDITIRAHNLKVFSKEDVQLAGPFSYNIAHQQKVELVVTSGAGKTTYLN